MRVKAVARGRAEVRGRARRKESATIIIVIGSRGSHSHDQLEKGREGDKNYPLQVRQ